MSDKKRSAKGKWKNTLLAAALTASVILALPAWSVGPAEAVPTPTTSERLVLKQDGKTIEDSALTIKRAGTEAAKQGTITVDLYKVAGAVKVENYDAYTLTITDTYAALAGKLDAAQKQPEQTEAGANAAYRDLAQDAAKIALGIPANGEGKPSPLTPAGSIEISENGIGKFDSLGAGMYLVIAHGKDLTSTPEKYIGTTTDGKVVTMAYNNGYVYNYLPELIALPMRGISDNAAEGSFSTAQSTGSWRYGVTAELKAEEEVERVPLWITKTFSGAENALLTGKNGCVFRIEAMLNGQKVYSNVVAAEFEKGQTPVVLKTEAVIPVGAIVTVTEVYDGAAFKGEGQNDDQFVTKTAMFNMMDDRRYDVSFTNTYNGINTGGDIVTNSFTKDAEGYHWNDPRSAQGNVTENND